MNCKDYLPDNSLYIDKVREEQCFSSFGFLMF